MAILSSVLDFLLVTFSCVAIVFSLVIFQGRRIRLFLYMSILAVLQLLLEISLRGGETASAVAAWSNAVFVNHTPFKGILYGLTALMLMLILHSMLGQKTHRTSFIWLGIIFLWFTAFPVLRLHNVLFYFLCLLPFHLYVICLALTGRATLKRLPVKTSSKLLARILLVIVVLSTGVIIEDILTCLPFGFMAEMEPLIASRAIKERNITESVELLFLLGCTIYVDWRVMLRALNAETASVSVGPLGVTITPVQLFAEAIGLSPRERELLPLLLGSKSIVEIADELVISQGTVKFHAHNIYQKADVRDRVGLIQRASAFSDGVPD